MAMSHFQSQLSIRPYTQSDFPVISGWWRAQETGELTPDMVPLETTWVLEMSAHIPALVVSLLVMNIRSIAMVENFIGNPELKGPERAQATKYLLQYIESHARSLGIKHLFCLSNHSKLKTKYTELGFRPTLDDVTTFIKPLTE